MNNVMLFKEASNIIPKGVNSPVRYFEPYPFFVKQGNGCKITDIEGNEYIDYCMGYGALLLGHAFKEIIDIVREQLDKGTLFCTPTEEEVILARLLSSIIPSAEMVRLMNTGSEATMHSIRLARAYTKKSKIVKFEGCYHGAYDYVLVKAGSGALEQRLLLSEGMLDSVINNTIVLPFNNIEAIEELFKRDNDIACIILEPVMANMGVILPEKDYLYKLRKITESNDTLLIFDEVITGFRLTLGGAQEYYGVKADLATFGKALSNGFVISALTGKKEVMSLLAPQGNVYQASTFAGNPLSVSASIATIKFLQRSNIYKLLESKTKEIIDSIRDSLKEFNIDAQINSIASIFQIFFTDKEVIDYSTAKSSNTNIFKSYFRALLKRGIFIPPSQFEACFISYMHEDKYIANSINAMREALRELR